MERGLGERADRIADLGAVDRVGGDELLDVGVGPLGEGLGAAVDLLEVVEEGEVARPVLLDALEVLPDPHRRAAAGPLIPWIPFDGGEVVWRLSPRLPVGVDSSMGWIQGEKEETTMTNGLAFPQKKKGLTWAGLDW